MAEGLTAKQERFCVEYVRGGSKSFTDAYRAVFNCSKMKPETVHAKASLFARDDKVRARIRDLQDDAARAAMISLEEHLEDLKRLRDGAVKAGRFGPAVTAEIARGKACGLYVERTELRTPADEPFNIVVFDGGDREPV